MRWLCIILILTPVHAWSSGLCAKSELTYFSCNTGKEVVSICASKEVTQYRSGDTKHVDFRYPANTAAPEGKLFYSEMGASGYQEKHLRFNDNGKTYVVFDRWNANHATGKESTTRGISIFRTEAIPKDGETAEFKRKFLVKEKTCNQSTGIQMEGIWNNIEVEEFIYGP